MPSLPPHTKQREETYKRVMITSGGASELHDGLLKSVTECQSLEVNHIIWSTKTLNNKPCVNDNNLGEATSDAIKLNKCSTIIQKSKKKKKMIPS